MERKADPGPPPPGELEAVAPAATLAGLGRRVAATAALGLTVTGILLALTWGPGTYQALAALDPRTLALALTLAVASWVINALRAWLAAVTMGHPVSFRVAFRAVMAGAFASGVTPFAGGGGVVEAWVLARDGLPYPLALASVTAWGLLTQLMLLVVSALTAFWRAPLPGLEELRSTLRWFLGAYAVGLGGAILACTRLEHLAGPVGRLVIGLARGFPGAASWLARITDHSRHFLEQAAYGLRALTQQRPWFVAASGALGAAYYLCIFALAPVIGRPLGLRLPAWGLIVAQSSLLLLGSLIPTPGSAGGLEAAMAWLIAPHLSRQVVGVYVTAWRVLTVYLSVGVGAFATLASLRSPVRPAGSRPAEAQPA